MSSFMILMLMSLFPIPALVAIVAMERGHVPAK